MSDFRANESKRVIQDRAAGRALWYPAQFYILAPRGLAQRILESGEGFGVMEFNAPFGWRNFDQNAISILRVAPSDKRATRLSKRDVHTTVKHQTGTLWTLANALARNEARQSPEG